jgi:hypothetical protein
MLASAGTVLPARNGSYGPVRPHHPCRHASEEIAPFGISTARGQDGGSGGRAIRDAKNPDRLVLGLTKAKWIAFLAGARVGKFD